MNSRFFQVYTQYYPSNINLPMTFIEKEVIAAVDELDALNFAKKLHCTPAVKEYRNETMASNRN